MVWESSLFTRRFLLFFSCLASVYFILLISLGNGTPRGDEIRYLAYADNLTHGFYSPEEDPHFRNGPSYPLFLTPFVAMNTPYLVMRMLNIGLVLGGLWFFFSFMSRLVRQKVALFATLLIGLYPPFLVWIPRMCSEPLAFFFMCGSLYFLILSIKVQDKSVRYIFLCALMFAGLIHTRIVFAYVSVAMVGMCILGFLIFKRYAFRQAGLAFALAFIFLLPWIGYTHSLTGKWFYLGTNSGESMYWMTSPYEGELGNWNSETKVPIVPELKENHGAFFDEIYQATHVVRDSTFKAIAKQNLSTHPEAYLKHWVANLSRFVFHFPYSFREEGISAVFFIACNMFFVVFGLLSLIPAWIRRQEIPTEILIVSLMALVYFGGSSLVHATTRYLLLFVVMMIPYLVYVYSELIQVQIKPPSPPPERF